MTYRFKVLISHDRGAEIWDAQVLEHDIGAQGKDPIELLSNLDVVLSAEIEEGLDDIKSAPKGFHERWEQGSEFLVPGYQGSYSYEMQFHA